MFNRLAAALLALGLHVQASPHWIWAKQKSPLKNVTLSHRFKVPAKIKQARLRLIADGAILRLQINGKPAATAEPFGKVVEFEADKFLKPGTNELILRGEGITGIASAALQLILTQPNGKPITIGTSPQWKSTGAKATV